MIVLDCERLFLIDSITGRMFFLTEIKNGRPVEEACCLISQILAHAFQLGREASSKLIMTDIAKFTVGGQRYEVSRSLLHSHPGTMLAKSASDQ